MNRDIAVMFDSSKDNIPINKTFLYLLLENVFSNAEKYNNNLYPEIKVVTREYPSGYRIDFITYNNQFDIYIIVENENKNEIL